MKLGILLSYYNVAKKLIDGENALDPSVKFKLLGVMRQLETYVTDYETVEGDTVGTLCSRFGLTLNELFDHNDKLYDMEIKPGTVLDISGGTCEK